MAIAMMVDNPEGSQEAYDTVREKLGLESPAGGIFHVAGPSPNGGWRLFEVWESEEDSKRFVKERRCRPSRRSGPPCRLRPNSGPSTTTWRRPQQRKPTRSAEDAAYSPTRDRRRTWQA
jgi:hypothetical protein